MSSETSLLVAPLLDDAIDRLPLIVTPETSVAEAIALMSLTRGYLCAIDADRCSKNLSNAADSLHDRVSFQKRILGARASCVLVVEDDRLLGILAERDIVRLTAIGVDLASLPIRHVMAHPVITIAESAFQDVFAALFLFRRYCIRHLVVVDDRQKVVGTVSSESIRQILKPTHLLKLRRVAEVMNPQVVHAPPTTSILELSRLMAQHQVSCVVIAKTDQWQDRLSVIEPIGIVTERDLVQFQALGLDLAATSAAQVMSAPLFLLSPEDSLWTAHQEMLRRHVQRLVVSWDWGAKIGIVTQTSLLKVFDPIELHGIVETLQQTIEQLQQQSGPQPSLGVPGFSEVETSSSAACDELLDRLQGNLEGLLMTPNLSIEEQQIRLRDALSQIHYLRDRLQSAPASSADTALEPTIVPRPLKLSPQSSDRVS